MNLGIIGLPQVGKKTIFRILTGLEAEKAPTKSGISYGMAAVRDARVDALTEMYQPKRKKYAEFEVALPPDIQPDVARHAEWLDPLRNSDALIHVVRAFEAPHVFHIEGNVDPGRDLELVETELLLADLELCEKRLERIEKEKHHKKEDRLEHEVEVLERFKMLLSGGEALRSIELNDEEMKLVRNLQFFTMKPVVVVFNTSEGETAPELIKILDSLARKNTHAVALSAPIEAELAELSAEEREVFMEELEIEEPASHRLSKAAYSSLGLISFFTVGPDEVRAWSVRKGAKAPEASGKIHTDLERGFIRANTIRYEDLIEAQSERVAKERNLYVLNGKDYTVQDGDVIEVRFNV